MFLLNLPRISQKSRLPIKNPFEYLKLISHQILISISELPFASMSKRVFVQRHRVTWKWLIVDLANQKGVFTIVLFSWGPKINPDSSIFNYYLIEHRGRLLPISCLSRLRVAPLSLIVCRAWSERKPRENNSRAQDFARSFLFAAFFRITHYGLS